MVERRESAGIKIDHRPVNLHRLKIIVTGNHYMVRVFDIIVIDCYVAAA